MVLPSNAKPSPRRAGSTRTVAGGEVDDSRDQLVALGALEHLADPGGVAERLLHQAQVAAARQAEARRLFLADAVGDERGRGDALALAHAVDQVVLDAAARDRAGDQAVAAHRQQRAGRARRRAPGLEHRHQPDGMAVGAPGARLLKHLQIEAVHGEGSGGGAATA